MSNDNTDNNNNLNNSQDFRGQGLNDPPPFSVPHSGYPYPHGGIPPQREMTFKDWIILNIVLLIPCVGLIMLLIWAFSNDNKTRSDFCKAYLIVNIAVVVIVFLFMFIFSFAMFGLIGSMVQYF
ncbi:MAG: hypothetical protein FWE24_10300 [Defluviitaleaceae bacterium]|nr:hypothetical protein [Defluviitaleaceae bacterium]